MPFEGLFTDVSLESPDTKSDSDFKTTNSVLQKVLDDKDTFCKLYEDTTLQALLNYELSNRSGSAQTMAADLAALYAFVTNAI